MASASTPPVNEPTRVVHTEKLKPMIKGPISGKLVSSGIGHVAFASVYSEKTCMKKVMIMLIGRAKRAPHWGVQLRFCVILY